MTIQTVPIFCKRCHVLALANFNGIPLCPKCLTAAVISSTDPYVLGQIKPLHILLDDLAGRLDEGRAQWPDLGGTP